MLAMMVVCLVAVDVLVLTVYTGLEVRGQGASLVVNREDEITVTGVSEREDDRKRKFKMHRHII